MGRSFQEPEYSIQSHVGSPKNSAAGSHDPTLLLEFFPEEINLLTTLALNSPRDTNEIKGC